MDAELFLDLLGNENRRRILRLLSRRPCYVTEISNTIHVAPKAVLEHLDLLEEGGLIESYTDRQRRKYFHIAEDLRVEVHLAPSGFDSVLEDLDEPMEIPSFWDLLPPELRPRPSEETRDLAQMARAFRQMGELHEKARALQRYIQTRAGEVRERLLREAQRHADGPLEAAVLAAVALGTRTPEDLRRELEADPSEVEAALRKLQERGLVRRRGESWQLEERE